VPLYPNSLAIAITLTLGAVRMAYTIAQPIEDRSAWKEGRAGGEGVWAIKHTRLVEGGKS
jgi:hypothetical protein